MITLSIKDNGSGIEDGLKKKLLKEIVDSESGSGIGLYIINRIIHQIGGDLKLTSSEEGTTITLVFNESWIYKIYKFVSSTLTFFQTFILWVL